MQSTQIVVKVILSMGECFTTPGALYSLQPFIPHEATSSSLLWLLNKE
jgi:hypothetical protein